MGWLIVVLLIVVLVGFVVLYNQLIGLRQLTRNAWSDVDVYLKRRADLIPNLVEAVKAYAAHESTLYDAIATARSAALTSHSVHERAAAESNLVSEMGRALILAERYPDLKASHNFSNLQKELSDTESKIASARQYYNACVRDLNIRTEAFPSALIAGMAGVKPAEFFEVTELSERNTPKVEV